MVSSGFGTIIIYYLVVKLSLRHMPSTPCKDSGGSQSTLYTFVMHQLTLTLPSTEPCVFSDPEEAFAEDPENR